MPGMNSGLNVDDPTVVAAFIGRWHDAGHIVIGAASGHRLVC
jgi:hypothetical protein